MFGTRKNALAFAGATLIAAALFAGSFRLPDTPREKFGEVPQYSYDDDASDYDDEYGDEGSGEGPDESVYEEVDDGAASDGSVDVGFGTSGARFASDDEIIDDTKGFEPTPMIDNSAMLGGSGSADGADSPAGSAGDDDVSADQGGGFGDY
ncbi:MAG: hypothetical protein AAF127_04440 [Pseudomonadota bacterium]